MTDNIDSKAETILRDNDRGGFTVPTAGLYPYQWNWDSIFVSLGFATFDESRAVKEIETLFEAQWDDGFLPHIVFRRDDPDYFPGPGAWDARSAFSTSGITQPPVAASAINDLWKASADDGIKSRLAALFPKVVAWHRWFHKYRVPGDANAVVITHPWESGRDNSPEWDAASANIDISGVKPYKRRDLEHADPHMRPTKLDYDRYMALVEFGREAGWDHEVIATQGPFRVADVGMTMILLRATRDLAELAGNLGHLDTKTELEGYIEQLEKGAQYLWDDARKTFCSRDTITGAHSGYVSSASFLYGYADVGDAEQRQKMAAHWERIGKASRYMVPSHDPDETLFDHMRYWRGPIWIVINYMVWRGFAERGWNERAERIRRDSADLIRAYGFNEAFSPVTGAGTGGKDFSWTAAMWLAWCGKDNRPATE
ncbi:MAG: hypothetical protein HKN35_14845 [Woeseia sp.]|nr:hypothetical protein [Woeseia sp.]